MTVNNVLGAIKSLIETEAASNYPDLASIPIYLPQETGEKDFPCITIQDTGYEPHDVLRGVLEPLSVETSIWTIPHSDGVSGTSEETHNSLADDLYNLLGDIQQIAELDAASELKVYDVWSHTANNERTDGKNVAIIEQEIVCCYIPDGTIEAVNDPTWSRNTEWLSMPKLTAGVDEAVHGLHPVFDVDSNYVALLCEGDYTVDWGDGNIEYFLSGVKAEHIYDYSDVSDSTEFSFAGGTARQTIIKITPQSGNQLTKIDFSQSHTDDSSNNNQFLDISVCAANVTDLRFRNSRSLERVKNVECGILTTAANMFYFCYSLQVVGVFDISGSTSGANMFRECRALRVAPSFVMSSLTSVNSMFRQCYALVEVPLFDTSNCTNAGSFFQDCTSLTEVPLLNLSLATNIASLFRGCRALKKLPLIIFSAASSADNIFQNCEALCEIPLFNFSNVSSFSNAFNQCLNLQVIPNIYMSSASSTSNAFNNCISLKKATVQNLSISTSFNNCLMGTSELDELMTALPTVSGQTLTLTNNPGSTTCDTSIATGKGWTVLT